jgi:UDP-N-acetyl-2-amino-2-deoxyglucuronate dehydrogenase
MNKYRVGIIGFGWVAGAHLEAFKKMDQFEPYAILSTRPLDPADLRKSHGVDVKVYNDIDLFMADKNIDVVDICTPHFLHLEQTLAASNAGKHVILEKPITLNFEDSVKMLKTIRKNKTRTSICFEVRFMSSVQTIRSIMSQGLIGDVYYGEADYFHGIGPWYANQKWEYQKKNGGSSLLRAGCHALDLLLYIMDEKVDEVFTYGNTNPNPIYEKYDYPLNTVTVMKFKNGAVGKVSSVTDCMQPYAFNVNIVGSDGSIKNDQFYSKKIEGLKGWSTLDVNLIDSGDVSDHPYVEQFAHFAECLDKGIEATNNLESAFESHRVVFAADMSAELGRPVRMDEMGY